MAYPQGLLSQGEEVVLDLHPHWRALILPVLAVPVTIGLGTFLAGICPHGSLRHPLQIAVAVVGVAVLARVSLWPYLRWQTIHYVVTTERIVLRQGVLARSGRDIPLNRINDVSFSHTLLERLLRSGTLTIESAGERGQLTLADIPHVESVQHAVYELVQDAGANQRGAGYDRGDDDHLAEDHPPRV